MKKQRADWVLDVIGKRNVVQWRVPSGPGKDFGECETRTGVIKVNPNASIDQQRDTLLHEVIHAIDHELDTGMRERQVRLLATGLFHFLRANPDAVRWLLSRDQTDGSPPSLT
jgi:hypothetical protein